MLEKSRLMLCVFALSMLIFNPFDIVLKNSANFKPVDDYSNIQLNGRTLNSINTNEKPAQGMISITLRNYFKHQF